MAHAPFAAETPHHEQRNECTISNGHDALRPAVNAHHPPRRIQATNRNYYEVKYIRLPDLLVEIAVARGSGTYRELMRKYKKVSLLILDEWLLYSLKESEARDLLS